ncbi:hypothetical protein JCM18916_3475 [Cutibacterium acnes JCM 18916]|nr:hypothetical protein JCM18916_3475 [Cutibacterium acnes JCM 18916]
MPLETKKTSTAIHLNPGKEVSYEANLTFDNAVLGDNKEEVKKTAPGCQELVGRAKNPTRAPPSTRSGGAPTTRSPSVRSTRGAILPWS